MSKKDFLLIYFNKLAILSPVWHIESKHPRLEEPKSQNIQRLYMAGEELNGRKKKYKDE